MLATPAEAAQAVADRLVYQGVTSILNFAATVLTVPDRVTVRKVDLGQELQILAYHELRKSDEPVLASPLADAALVVPQEGDCMSILAVSVSHKTTSMDVLSRVAMDPSTATKLAQG